MKTFDLNNFDAVLKLLWVNKKFIATFTLVFAFILTSLSFLIPNNYESSAIFKIRDVNQNKPDIGNLGGYAALAGVSLPTGGSVHTEYVVEILKSKILLKELLELDGFREKLFAANGYDFSNKKIKYKKRVFDSKTKTWKRKTDGLIGSIPSYIEIHEHSAYEKLKVSHDKSTDFIKISFEHPSPYFAKDFIDVLVSTADSKIKEDDLDEALKALEYLRNKIQEVEIEEIKESIVLLIEEKLNTVMLANIHDNYSLMVIEPTFVPEEKSSPSRFFILVISITLGLLISSIFIISIEFRNNYKNLQTNGS